MIHKNYTLIETKSDMYKYETKNIKINHSLERDKIYQKLKLSLIHRKYVKNNHKMSDLNSEEIDFLARS